MKKILYVLLSILTLAIVVLTILYITTSHNELYKLIILIAPYIGMILFIIQYFLLEKENKFLKQKIEKTEIDTKDKFGEHSKNNINLHKLSNEEV